MLDLTQLRSFIAVHQAQSFSGAARQLGLGQSTISQHIQSLEASVGRKLIERSTHHLALTSDGEALLGHAVTMIDMDAQVRTLFADGALRGRLRLGLCEDIANGLLPSVLARFIATYPAVDLELTIALSGELYAIFERGELDLVLAKRRQDDRRGTHVYSEPLVWTGRSDLVIEAGRKVPLVSFPPPSVTRSAAIEILNRHKIAWQIVCTCGSLSGLRAAALAGMGVMVQPRSMVPEGLVELTTPLLPRLEDVEFVLVSRRGADKALIGTLSEEILAYVSDMLGDKHGATGANLLGM
jgi:DNA-binding transcriptional LysR family regulator